jgi:hypothetical protein
MEREIISATIQDVRKLFIFKQHLYGEKLQGTFRNKMITILRDAGYIQWDPVTVVAPSHMISIWSRIGYFKAEELEKMMWNDREAFLHWVPTAWIVLTEDYPIFHSLMKNYPDSLRSGWTSHIEPAREFMESHKDLEYKVINHLRQGPANTAQLSGYGKKEKSNDGWSTGNEVTRLMFHLHMSGRVMVSGHSKNQNVWSLTDDYLPEWTVKTEFTYKELERRTAIRALKALGVASEQDIFGYFIRGRYLNLKSTLKDLYEEQEIVKVSIVGQPKSKSMFLLSEDVGRLDSIISEKGENEVNLVSPFDNLLTLRKRLKRLFNFEYSLEQFVPEKKRKYGTYVLPVLYGSEMVGRIDARLDRHAGILEIKSVYAEPGYEGDELIADKLMNRIEELANFLNAERIVFGNKKPEKWSNYLS